MTGTLLTLIGLQLIKLNLVLNKGRFLVKLMNLDRNINGNKNDELLISDYCVLCTEQRNLHTTYLLWLLYL